MENKPTLLHTELVHNRRYWIWYTVDWVILIVLLMTALVIAGFVDPFERAFVLGDPSLAYPHKSEDFINYFILLGALVVTSVLTFALFQIKLRSATDFHKACLGIVQAFVLCFLFAEITKVFSGRLRPDWYARCKPIVLDDFPVCSETDKGILKEGRKSFFSSHAATAFVFGSHLSLYLAGKLRVNDHHGHFYKVVLVSIPLLFAFWVGITRTQDYRHHWEDVLVGAIAGTFFGTVLYLQHYPNPFTSSKTMDLPYTYIERSFDKEIIIPTNKKGIPVREVTTDKTVTGYPLHNHDVPSHSHCRNVEQNGEQEMTTISSVPPPSEVLDGGIDPVACTQDSVCHLRNQPTTKTKRSKGANLSLGDLEAGQGPTTQPEKSKCIIF